MIDNKHIISLDISWNGFGDMDPLAVICDLLCVNTTLTSFDLSSNRVCTDGWCTSVPRKGLLEMYYFRTKEVTLHVLQQGAWDHCKQPLETSGQV